MGEWVGGVGGKDGGRGKAGRAEVIHVGRAHRESNLSTFRSAKGTHFSYFKASNDSVVGHRQYCERQWINLSSEAFPSADVSMNFSGKLPNVLLLVLLAAQGKLSDPRRAAEPRWVGLLDGAGVTLSSTYLMHTSVLLCSLHYFKVICTDRAGWKLTENNPAPGSAKTAGTRRSRQIQQTLLTKRCARNSTHAGLIQLEVLTNNQHI